MPELLDHALELAWVDAASGTTVRRDGAARYFAQAVRLATQHPHAVLRVQDASQETDGSGIATLLTDAVDQAMKLTQADTGDLQLVDPATGELRIVATAGFDQDFLDNFGVIRDDSTVCGTAVRIRDQVAVRDLHHDARFRGFTNAADRAGFRGVLSTPIFDFAGRLLGVVSTHSHDPRDVPPLRARSLALYSDFVGDRLSHLLGDHAPGPTLGDTLSGASLDPVARAMVLALLLNSDVDGDGITPPDPQMPLTIGSRPEVLNWLDFTDILVTGLFRAQLGLDGLQSLMPDGMTMDRLRTISGDIDSLMITLRTRLDHEGWTAGP